MPKTDRCELCGVDISGEDRGTFVVDQVGICSGKQWTTMRFPELPVGREIEAHTGCAELWELPPSAYEEKA